MNELNQMIKDELDEILIPNRSIVFIFIYIIA